MVIWAAISFAQESVKPSYGVKTERPVAIALINDKRYYDVTVELSSAEITDMFVEGVKVTVRDENGKKIYKKRFSKSRLYAFFAADEIYVPVAAEILPLKGIMMIENVLEDLREAKPEIKISGVFVTRFDSRKNINKSVEEAVRAQYEDVVFQTHIRDHVSLSEAPGSGGSIFDNDSKGRGAQDYLALTQEIIERTK